MPWCGRAQQRKHQVRAGTYAPVAEGLAEIFRSLGQFPRGGYIKDTAQAEHGIEGKPAKGTHGRSPFHLNQPVGEVRVFGGFVEKFGYPAVSVSGVQGRLPMANGRRDQRSVASFEALTLRFQ